ncbi:MAG: hypothetical protein ABL888_05655 [Pirellulaceae bacterium]
MFTFRKNPGAIILIAWLLATSGSSAFAQKSPTVIQRERNPFPGGKWAISNRGDILISSNKDGTLPHLWTANKYVTNKSLDSRTFDYLKFSEQSDIFLIAQSEPLRKFQSGDVGESLEIRGQKLLTDPFKEKSKSPFNDKKKDTYDITLLQAQGKKGFKPWATLEVPNAMQWLAVSGDGQRVALFNPETSTIEIAQIREGFNTSNKRFKDILYPTQLFDMQLTAKGGQLLVAQESRVSLVDTDSGIMLQAMKIDPAYKEVHFSYGGRYLVAKDTTAKQAIVIELKSGRDLRFDIDPADKVSITPDGQWLAQITKSEIKFTKLSNRSESYSELLHDDCNTNCFMAFASLAGRMIVWSDEPQRLYVVVYPFGTK